MLRRSFTGFAKDIFKQLFAAIVTPNLKYEAPIWSHHSKEQIILIRNVQGMAAYQVQGISDISYKERLETMCLRTLQHRRYRGYIIGVYKFSHGFMMKTLLAIPRISSKQYREYNIASIYLRRVTGNKCENVPSDASNRPVEQPSRFRCKRYKS